MAQLSEDSLLTPQTDSFLVPIDSPRGGCAPRARKWGKNLPELALCAPEFVLVKRYLISELLSLRQLASIDVDVDVHHIENSIVSARQRAAFQSPIPLNLHPTEEPAVVISKPLKEHSESEGENKDWERARSSSPTVVHVSSDDEVGQEKSKGKKFHRSGRGGKRHRNKKKVASGSEFEGVEDVCAEPASADTKEEKFDTLTREEARRVNKNRATRKELAERSGKAFSSGVMRKRRLEAKAKRADNGVLCDRNSFCPK